MFYGRNAFTGVYVIIVKPVLFLILGLSESLGEPAFPDEVAHNDINRGCDKTKSNAQEEEQESQHIDKNFCKKRTALWNVAAIRRKEVNVSHHGTY